MNYNACLVNVKPLPNCVKLPHYETDGAVAADAYAAISEPVNIAPGETRIIPLGFSLEVPDGFTLAVLPRSGLASRSNVIACLGLVDADFRGEVGAIITNSKLQLDDACKNCDREDCHYCLFATQKRVITKSEDTFVVHPGDRICQVALIPVVRIGWNPVDTLPETVRGDGGFGSTGTR